MYEHNRSNTADEKYEAANSERERRNELLPEWLLALKRYFQYRHYR
ncbi:hypothetical protein ACFL34_04870 [Candidatus Sumerlaeota bacterium]